MPPRKPPQKSITAPSPRKRKLQPKTPTPELNLPYVSRNLTPALLDDVPIPKRIRTEQLRQKHSGIIVPDVIDIIIPSKLRGYTSWGELPSTTSSDAPSEEAKTTITYPERWTKLVEDKRTFYINKLIPLTSIPSETKRWIRNACDERAAQEGMKFSEQSGYKPVEWISTHCVLYEGSRAGEYMSIDDWQFEYLMQLFGWMQFSEELNRWLRRFNQAGIWIAKKNAKSPTLAASGLYCTCADGELGNHCYSVARDGKQALIAHTHAMKMVEMSPRLSEQCIIKKTDYSITHKATGSNYVLVHGDNTKSTEGFNGSIFIDETHVVDQNQIDRLKRAGISRDEPLHVEMSTAGNNSDGYGFNRYHYGLRVSKMETESDYVPNFLFIDFSIDQKVTIDKLRDEAYVLSIAERCNPTMGRILRKSEFTQDYRDSVRSDTELRKFAMYRLNLWLQDSTAWIEQADWIACAESPLKDEINYDEGTEDNPRQFTLDDLRNYPCVLGLDLSKTRDMTSLSAVFAVPDPVIGVRPYTWTWCWMPLATANAYSRYVDFASEEFKPWLHLLNTKTIDYDQIIEHIEWLRKHFDVRALGYDVYNATELMRILTLTKGWDEDLLIKVPQTMRYMGPITQEVERWIVRKEVHHANNLLMTWQMGHAALDTDRFGNYRVMKPGNRADYRKVDGIISLLIACTTMCSEVCSDLWAGRQSILLYDFTPKNDTNQYNTLTPKKFNIDNINE